MDSIEDEVDGSVKQRAKSQRPPRLQSLPLRNHPMQILPQRSAESQRPARLQSLPQAQRSATYEVPGTRKWAALPALPDGRGSGRAEKGKERAEAEKPSPRPPRPRLTIVPPKVRRPSSFDLASLSPDFPLRTAKEYPSDDLSARPSVLRNTSLPSPRFRFPSSNSSASPSPSPAEDYGPVLNSELDPTALRQLPPRLQTSLLSVRKDRGRRISVQGLSESEVRAADYKKKREPLSSNPPTEIERADAIALKGRARKVQIKQPPPIHSSISGPTNRRQLVKRKSYTNIQASSPRRTKVAERMGSARKWIKKLFKKKARDVEDDWEEDEDEEPGDDDGAAGHRRQHSAPLEQLTARGRMEGYF